MKKQVTELFNSLAQRIKDNRDLEALHDHVFDLLDAGRAVEAAALMAAWRREAPASPHLAHLFGFMLSELGHQDRAIPLLQRAAAALPNKTLPLVTLGIALMRQHRLSEAEAELERALTLDADCPLVLTSLATCLLAQAKSPGRAEQFLRKADELMPNDQAVLANLGMALARQGKHAEAAPVFHRANCLDPHSDIAETIADFQRNYSNN